MSVQFQTRLGLTAWNERVESLLDRHDGRLLTLAIALFVAFRGLFVYQKPVWFDELVTYYVTRTFSWREMFQAVRLAVDAQPPTYHLLQTPALLLLGDDPRELRWLTLLASAAALAATFVWLRRSTGPAAALAATAMLMGSKLSFYALEARPYALLVASASLALACRGLGWRIVWLAVGVSLHYYGAFIPLAFVFAEENWRRRAALLLALSPLLVTIPAMHSFSLLAGGSLFTPVAISLLTTVPVLAGRSRYVLAVLFVLGMAWWLGCRKRPWPIGDRISWALIALAPLSWLACYWFTGIFVARYAIVSLLGLAGLVAWLVHRLPHRGLVSAAVSLGCMGASFSTVNFTDTWDARPTAHLVHQSINAFHLPVVMGKYTSLDVHYHLSPGNRRDFHWLSFQPPGRISWSMTAAPVISQYAGMSLYSWEDWVAKHSAFVVVADAEANWILAACRKRGATISVVSRNATHQLYLVRLPAAVSLAATLAR